MNRLKEKITLITGAGSGIGLETARRFAAEGASVAITDVSQASVEAAAESISQEGGNVIAMALDVTDVGQVEEGLARTVSEFGGLDAVVNNAGLSIAGRMDQFDVADWDRLMAVNVKGPFLVSRGAWPHLVERGGGTILNTASAGGLWAMPGDGPYSTSKAALIMMTKCLATDGGRHSIRSNVVCPGPVDTPMLRNSLGRADNGAVDSDVQGFIALPRVGTPRDIADAFVYLASDDASWVTGAVLAVDGGMTLGLHPLP